MDFGKEGPLTRVKWYLVVIYIALVALVLLSFFTGFFQTSVPGQVPQFVWLGGALIFLITLIIILSKTINVLSAIEQNGAKLDKIANTLEKNTDLFSQIAQNTRLSETAKAIAFRDADRQSLREAVFDKLQQQDFESTYAIIDEIAHSTVYHKLAQELRIEADKYRNATDVERENQVIAHIEKLFEVHQWAKASSLIERLIKAAPNPEKAKALRQKLLDKKAERKKILLGSWDDAVNRQATDRSIQILRELDLYLTPNEGLALQEAARDVFRNKLHSLGVQFSLAVSGKNWAKAQETGRQIIHSFPNSKMAREIRGKMNILKQKIGQQS